MKTDDNLSRRARAKIKPVNITVSIVEDDAPARGILTEWIRGADGFRCIGAHEDAETALAALPQEKPSVVLMDINMPGMSGIECVRRLKPQMMDTQFVMLTVYEDPDHIFRRCHPARAATCLNARRAPNCWPRSRTCMPAARR